MRPFFLFFFVLVISLSLVSATNFGYDNPTLPKLVPAPSSGGLQGNGSTINSNNSYYWNGLGGSNNIFVYNHSASLISLFGQFWYNYSLVPISTFNASYLTSSVGNATYLKRTGDTMYGSLVINGSSNIAFHDPNLINGDSYIRYLNSPTGLDFSGDSNNMTIETFQNLNIYNPTNIFADATFADATIKNVVAENITVRNITSFGDSVLQNIETKNITALANLTVKKNSTFDMATFNGQATFKGLSAFGPTSASIYTPNSIRADTNMQIGNAVYFNNGHILFFAVTAKQSQSVNAIAFTDDTVGDKYRQIFVESIWGAQNTTAKRGFFFNNTVTILNSSVYVNTAKALNYNATVLKNSTTNCNLNFTEGLLTATNC